jgi:hypothetical protein
MTAAVGADIESMCAKCGDVWHVVVAMVGSQVAKVQCKQCGGYHRHKSPKAAAAAAARPRRPSRAKKETATSRAPAKPTIDQDKPIRPYRMSDVEPGGEQFEHMRYAVGVVEAAAEPGKRAVVFDEGRKVLATAKGEGQLASNNDLVRAARRASDAAE